MFVKKHLLLSKTEIEINSRANMYLNRLVVDNVPKSAEIFAMMSPNMAVHDLIHLLKEIPCSYVVEPSSKTSCRTDNKETIPKLQKLATVRGVSFINVKCLASH